MTGSRLRFAVWLLHLALPLLGLWLLVAQPGVDAALHWQHNPSHFAIVLAAALLSTGMALRVRRDARAHADARLTLIALAFFTAAGFLALHALATPKVLMAGPNAGFEIASPTGLALAGVLAVGSSLPLDRERSAAIVRVEPWLLGALAFGSVAFWKVGRKWPTNLPKLAGGGASTGGCRSGRGGRRPRGDGGS